MSDQKRKALIAIASLPVTLPGHIGKSTVLGLIHALRHSEEISLEEAKVSARHAGFDIRVSDPSYLIDLAVPLSGPTELLVSQMVNQESFKLSSLGRLGVRRLDGQAKAMVLIPLVEFDDIEPSDLETVSPPNPFPPAPEVEPQKDERPTFERGDLVCLKSDRYVAMTVEATCCCEAECIWFNGRELQERSFPLDCLMKYHGDPLPF